MDITDISKLRKSPTEKAYNKGQAHINRIENNIRQFGKVMVNDARLKSLDHVYKVSKILKIRNPYTAPVVSIRHSAELSSVDAVVIMVNSQSNPKRLFRQHITTSTPVK